MTPDQVIARAKKRDPIKFSCPKCGKQGSKVLMSRGRRRYEMIWRRRQCTNRFCRAKYSTYEIRKE